MSLEPDFIQYIRLHWGDGDDDVSLWRHFHGLTQAQAVTQISGTVHSIGALAIVMALIMVPTACPPLSLSAMLCTRSSIARRAKSADVCVCLCSCAQ